MTGSNPRGLADRARHTAGRAARATLVRVPTGVLPGALRDRAEQARLRRAAAVARRSPDEALRLLHPLLEGPHAVEAARHTAQILVRRDRSDEAYRVLQGARAHADGSSRFLLLYARLAREHGDLVPATAALHEVVGLVPPGQKALDRTVQELRHADRALAEQLRVTLASAPEAARLDTAGLRDLLDAMDLELAAERGPRSLEDEVHRLRDARSDALPVIARVLTRLSAWDLLVRELDRGDGGQTPPLWRLRRSAARALREGHLTAAVRLADTVLRHDPDDAETTAVRDRAADQLALLQTGWPAPTPPAPVEHTPRPGAVLALLGQSLPIRSGGYATRSHGILTSLAARGWDMAAATRLGFPYDLWWSADDPRPLEPVDVVDGIPYHRLLQPGVRDYPRVPLADYVARGAALATEVGREHGAALVHAASLSDVALTGAAVADRLGVPFVYEMRGLKQLLEEALTPQFAGSQAEQALDLLESTAARRADRLFVITEALGAEMVRMGVDPTRITVVPNGVHVERFTPRPGDTTLLHELGLEGKVVVGYAGGLVHYEGLDLLLEAAALLRRTRRDVHVLVVGDGADERRLHATARSLGLGDAVTFTGRVPHHDVERYLSLVDVTPFPRLPLRVCELISPIKPFEAMAMAKAVVVSDVAALTEIVQDGQTGRAFTKGSAEDLARVLGELADDPAERDRLGEQAREWVVRHRDWARITDRVDAAYRELLPASSPA